MTANRYRDGERGRTNRLHAWRHREDGDYKLELMYSSQTVPASSTGTPRSWEVWQDSHRHGWDNAFSWYVCREISKGSLLCVAFVQRGFRAAFVRSVRNRIVWWLFRRVVSGQQLR